jgi:two-component system, LytTR family, sensor kinase
MSDSTRHLTVYWTTQVLGWTLYVGLFGFIVWLQGDYKAGQGDLLLITMLVGLTGSHLLRGLFRRAGWLELPIPSLIPRLLLGIVLVGCLATAVQILVHDGFFPESEPMLNGSASQLVERLLAWVIILLIWTVLYLAHRYFLRSRREEIRALRMETADRANQLANLRSQMNPHFMFNALNGIRALIDEDPARAKQSITQLSAILRNAMTTVKRVTVPLGEELDMVKAYLDLEHMRYEERLRVSFDVDPALVRDPVPPMMLQTLVENAVRHGVANRPEGGEVRISAQKGLNGLVLSVSNTGVYEPGKVKGTGIGLRNTRERLQRIYGDRANLNIINADGMVITEVEMPANGLRDIPEI